jgi:ATP-dependent DNA helicase PIF1
MTQPQALSVLTTGASVFLTGEPGSGKTHTVNQYVNWLREHNIEPAITASTGIAATHIGGVTIHSWSGIGIADKLTDKDLSLINQNRRVTERIKNTHVLIIDEVSMLSASTLSMVDAVCRKVRGNEEPFGGLQVVLVGDFFQLPPIFRPSNDEQPEFLSEESAKSQFAYDSAAWKKLNPFVCYLSEQHRQEDAIFLDMLTAIRQGKFTDEHRALLQTRHTSANEEVTQLYSHNANVDSINTSQLDDLPDRARVFEMEARGPAALVETLTRGCLSPSILTLKEGAKVMFTKNDIAGRKFMNGTLGTVIGFEKETNYPIVVTHSGRTVTAEPMEWSLQEEGRVLARITQVPLRLAWAITVHKSQGMSLDAAHIDLSRAFEYGQGYVALSRVRTLAGLSLGGLNTKATQVDPNILAKDQEFREDSINAYAEFARIPEKTLQSVINDFILECGGNLVAQRVVRKEPKVKVPTREITKEMVLRGLSLSAIAQERGLTEGTIINHLEELKEQKLINPETDLAEIAGKQSDSMTKIHAAFDDMGVSPLKPIFEHFDGNYEYDTLRLARLLYKHPAVIPVETGIQNN